ncbi:MAG: lysophospholipid acyltransferase family protein [Gemmatimonadota bacterium]|nr:lysophospholipid acyltransferase family protein [Gemmatimonadota bacterium]
MRAPTIADRAQYVALRGVVGALGWLPGHVADTLGSRIGVLGYRPLAVRRPVVERQIAAAFPGLDDDEVQRIARESYAHLGRVTIETALLHRRGRQGVLDMVEQVDGWDVIEGALALGRGVILVTGHFGNWELAAAYVAARGVPIDVVVRGMNNPLFDGYLTRTRSRLGMAVVHDQVAVRRTMQSLRANRAVGFVIDQGVLHLASTYVPFFGRPAKTPRGPAVFAMRWGVPVVFGVARREPGGRYRLAIEAISTPEWSDRERGVEELVRSYTSSLERWVRRSPEQYFWHHRRWKWQPADTPADQRDPSA